MDNSESKKLHKIKRKKSKNIEIVSTLELTAMLKNLGNNRTRFSEQFIPSKKLPTNIYENDWLKESTRVKDSGVSLSLKEPKKMKEPCRTDIIDLTDDNQNYRPKFSNTSSKQLKAEWLKSKHTLTMGTFSPVAPVRIFRAPVISAKNAFREYKKMCFDVHFCST